MATGAEQHGEQHHNQAEHDADDFRRRIRGEQAGGNRDCLNLHAQQGQNGCSRTQGDQGARPLAAVTIGKKIGQRRQLVGAAYAEDRVEQNRCQQESAADAQVIGQEAVAGVRRHTNGAVNGPDAGINAKAEGIDQWVAYPTTQ